MTRALIKVIGLRFYEQNTAFFLFIFFLMFGIVESSQLLNYHLSLIVGMINAPIFLLLVCGAWLLYGLKCFAFIVQRLNIPENEFLFRLNEVDARRLFFALLLLTSFLALPMLVYSGIVAGVAIHSGHFLPAGEIVFFHCVILMMWALMLYRKINTPHIQRWTTPFLYAFRWRRPRPFPFFYIGQLTSRMKIALAISKAFSFFSIIGFLQIPADGYDVRIALLGFLFGLAGHTVIIFDFRRFEDQYLFFTRNLPIALFRRFANIAIVYVVILIPELALLLVNKINFFDIAAIAVFGSGFLMILHCLLYKVRLDMDRHTQYLLAFFLISFMVVLMRLYLVEAFVLWGVAFFIYNRSFYEFEGEKG